MTEHTPPPAPSPDDPTSAGPAPADAPTAVLGQTATDAPTAVLGQAASGYPAAGAYPPPGYPPAGYPPPHAAAGPAPAPPSGPARRLTRSRSDRWLGGVNGGLARYWNTDPTLLRILTVVLTLATGGALLVGYLIAWIAIPQEPYDPYRPGPGAQQAGYATDGNPPYADQAPAAFAPPPRERSYLGWLVVSAAVLVAGLLGLLGAALGSSAATPGIIGGVVLAVLGVGLVLGTWYGRVRWLTLLAIPVAFATFIAVAAGSIVSGNPNWDRWVVEGTDGQLAIGDRTWTVTPEQVSGGPLDFRVSAGQAVLDLTGLTRPASAPGAGAGAPADGQRVSIDASVGAGFLLVLLPTDMRLELSGSVDLGEVSLPDQPVKSGSGLSVTTTIDPADAPPAYIVTLDAVVGVGSLEVQS